MNRIIFLNVGWMKSYRGLAGDSIVGGGSFVRERGYGFEIFNFLPHQGYMYGYAQVKGSINIARLGASRKDNSVNDTLAVWVARSPSGGAFIVGWYNPATVYRQYQPAPEGSGREYKGEELGYHVKAREEHCVLLPVDHRVFRIPRGVPGGMGQSNIWYADQPENSSFREDVLGFVTRRRIPPSKQFRPKKGRSWQPDPHRCQKVEGRAIDLVVEHYTRLGYAVDSVEKDNVGWDLEAELRDKLLRLEVKGLSHNTVSIELTPNEYDKMKQHRPSYRICVVTNALSNEPTLQVFSFSPDTHKWEDDDGNQLSITEVVSAKMSTM
jgi:hypothetical protein